MQPPAISIPIAASSSQRGAAAPSPFDPTRFDHLSEAEILGRIGGLLATAMIRSGRLSHPAPRPANGMANAASLGFDPVALPRDPVARQVVDFLRISGPSTPGEVASALGIKRRTLARKLRLLRCDGLCVATGKTRTARYEFRADVARN